MEQKCDKEECNELLNASLFLFFIQLDKVVISASSHIKSAFPSILPENLPKRVRVRQYVFFLMSSSQTRDPGNENREL